MNSSIVSKWVRRIVFSGGTMGMTVLLPSCALDVSQKHTNIETRPANHPSQMIVEFSQYRVEGPDVLTFTWEHGNPRPFNGVLGRSFSAEQVAELVRNRQPNQGQSQIFFTLSVPGSSGIQSSELLDAIKVFSAPNKYGATIHLYIAVQ